MEEKKQHLKLIKKMIKANPKYAENEDLLEEFCNEAYQKSYLILQAIEDKDSLNAYMKKIISSAIIDVLKENGRLIKPIKPKNLSLKTEKNEGKQEKKVEEESVEVNLPTELSIDGNLVSENENTENSEIILDEFLETDILKEIDGYVSDKGVPQDSDFDSLQNDVEQYSDKSDSIENQYPNKPPILEQNLLYVADPRENIEEQIIREDIVENIINSVKQIDEENPNEFYFDIFKERYFRKQKQKDIAVLIGISEAEVSKKLVHLSSLIKEKLY